VQQLWLGSSLLAAWLVMSVPIARVGGSLALVWLAIAAVLCFLPGCLVLTLQPLWKTAGAAGLGAMSGTVLRIVFVSLGMVAVVVGRPPVSPLLFGIELSVFYLVALVVETLLVVRDINRNPVKRVS